MFHRKPLFSTVGIKESSPKQISEVAEQTGLSREYLKYLQKNSKLPTVTDLARICDATNTDLTSAKLALGLLDAELIERLSGNSDTLAMSLPTSKRRAKKNAKSIKPAYENSYGKLYKVDCVKLMETIPSESFDVVFADPPFNLNKDYPSNIDDALKDSDYLDWCFEWLEHCVRTLKFGGSLFLYNLPRWNIPLGHFLNERLTFRHWVAIDLKYSLPIAGRLYPSHYSMLYFVKGNKPKTFKPDRMPMETCPICFGDLKDYGGYKDKMNPKGVNLTDIWKDISPVRHSKYKRRKEANELPIKLLDRVIEMSSEEGDLVFDPFGGSGTTYVVAEIKRRRWLGCEIGPVEGIVSRMEHATEEAEFIEKHRGNYNELFPASVKKNREQRGLWTCESVRKKKASSSMFPEG